MTRRLAPWLLGAALIIAALAITRPIRGAERDGWIIALGQPTPNKIQCELDAASVGIVLQKTWIRCVRVDTK